MTEPPLIGSNVEDPNRSSSITSQQLSSKLVEFTFWPTLMTYFVGGSLLSKSSPGDVNLTLTVVELRTRVVKVVTLTGDVKMSNSVDHPTLCTCTETSWEINKKIG